MLMKNSATGSIRVDMGVRGMLRCAVRSEIDFDVDPISFIMRFMH
jgi:hypothetical protein